MDSYWLTWFPGALLASLGVLALCWRGVRAFTRIQSIVPQVETMLKEFSPNSGHSMRDQVDNQTKQHARLAQDFTIFRAQQLSTNEQVKQRFDRQDRALDRIEDRQQNLEGKLRP